MNPQVAVATLNGAKNTVPSFITLNGPVREARFVNATAPAGAHDRQAAHGNGEQAREVLDGGVHDLYTITGRNDAPGCTLAQPDFVTELAKNNVIFRIPTPVFGLGLVEEVPDSTLEANAQPGAHFNHSGNDGTITKFGWKAQNKSLLIFAMEAYNVEQGVTNFGFPNERDDTPGCQFNTSPEDSFHLTGSSPPSGSPASDYSSDVENFAAFMRLSAPPAPALDTSSTINGRLTFMRSAAIPATCRNRRRMAASISSRTATSPSTPWAMRWPMASFRVTPLGMSSAPRRCGASASACSFCTTAAQTTCCRPSNHMPVRVRRQARS